MNIHSYIEKSKVNGPGERFVLWTQGCSKKCINCFNYNTWSFKEREILTPISIFEKVKNVNCDGVTITGGDPFKEDELMEWSIARFLNRIQYMKHKAESEQFAQSINE